MPIPLARTTLTFALLSTALFQGTPSAQNRSCEERANNTHDKLLQCVTVDGVTWHLAALQTIADANGGTRAAGTPGYDASVQYVVEQMTAAGYNVTLNPFPIRTYPAGTLQQLTPSSASYETGTFTGSGSGTVTASVTAVDVNLTPPRASTSGCEAADFGGFPVGDIALIQRGTCAFAVKAQNAQAAGASAVIIFNQGNTPAREALFIGTLEPITVTIPVVGATFAAGQNLAQPGSSAAMTVPPSQIVTQYNVIAESLGGDPHNVVMAGAHLDSVIEGPGIQDNGSGSAALIEIARQMARVKPRNKVRFAWWGAEEMGLVGSRAYVAGLSDADRARIALYLNFDMIASPNFGFFIYDGDDSDGVGAGPGPAGSAHIEQTFQAFFDARGLAHKGTDFSGRSDYGPFIAVGIPSGGLFTGADGIKNAEAANLWGGTAGELYDPCYHLACDTFANVNTFALEVNADAAAYAILQYAMTTQGVNGKRGKGNFKP
jgi:Zn-dependent M28 family amino/carboxypeptidase